MSYLVLARKSRPQTFDQVIGQRPVVQTLRNSLAKNRVAHALLFSGVRGVGKTTLARIMAKAINCERREDNPPCNECLSCKEITAGSALDLYEIDGASNRGIQEIRELKEKIRFLPTSSKYRIIIIDEVHMLTTEAFNALLKTLEEPPEHVYFMFATTELHKIPITILSRCQQYELKRVSSEDLSQHFLKLIHSEEKDIEQEALNLIVREAAGSVRDGLSLLDQVLSFSEDKISTEDVVQVLGLVNRDVLIAMCKALLDGDKATAIISLDEIFRFGMDTKRFCTDIISLFRTLLLCKIEGCRELIDLPEEEFQNFYTLAKSYSAESLHVKMNMLIEMVEHIGRSTQPRLVLETTFLKIIETGNITAVSELIAKLGDFLKSGGQLPPQTQFSQTAPSDSKKKVNLSPTEPVLNSEQQYEAPQPSRKQPDLKQQQSAPPAIPSQETNTKHGADIRANWKHLIEHIAKESRWMAQALTHATKIVEEATTLTLHFKDETDCVLLKLPEHSLVLQQFIVDFFDKKRKILFSTPKYDGPGENSNDGAQAIRQELMTNPLVIATAEIFRGHVGDIRPLKKNKK